MSSAAPEAGRRVAIVSDAAGYVGPNLRRVLAAARATIS